MVNKAYTNDPVAEYVAPLFDRWAAENIRKKFVPDNSEANAEYARKTIVTTGDGGGITGYSFRFKFWLSPLFWITSALSSLAGTFMGFFGYKKVKDRDRAEHDQKILEELVKLNDSLVEKPLVDENQKELWKLSAQIHDHETRYKLQWMIRHRPEVLEKDLAAAKINAEAQIRAQEQQAIPEFNSHQALNDTLTTQEKVYWGLSLGFTFLKWFIPLLCLAGVLFVSSSGFGFNPLKAFFNNTIGLAFFGGAVGAGVLAVIAKTFTFSHRKQKIIEARYEKAEEEFNANNQLFENLLSFEKQGIYKDRFSHLWKLHFGPEQKASPSRVAIQNDFLKGMRAVIADSNKFTDFDNKFLAKIKIPVDTPKLETVIVTQEQLDLQDMRPVNQLPKKENRNLFLTSLGLGIMWFICAASAPGVNFTHAPTLIALFTTPTGWIMLAAFVAVGLLLAIPRYFIERAKKLEEREEKIQDYLLAHKKDYDKIKNDLTAEEKERWTKIQAIGEPSRRAAREREFFDCRLDPTRPKPTLLTLSVDVIQYKAVTKPGPIFDLNKYQRFNENNLTNRERLRVGFNACFSFLEFGGPVFFLGGLTVVHLGTLLTLVPAVFNWPLVALCVAAAIVGIIVGAVNTHIEIEKIKKEREEKAQKEMEFNQLEFERLLSQENMLINKNDLRNKWLDINNNWDTEWGGNLPAKAQIQRDFLQGVKCVMNGTCSTEDFNTQFNSLKNDFKICTDKYKAEQAEIEKNKNRDIPDFEKNQKKYAALAKGTGANFTLTSQERRDIVVDAFKPYIRTAIPVIFLALAVAGLGLSIAGALVITGPVGGAILLTALIVITILAIRKMRAERESKLTDRKTREATVHEEIDKHEAEYNKIMAPEKVSTLDPHGKISEKWTALTTMGNSLVKAEMQKDFLEGLRAVEINPEKHYKKFEKNCLDKLNPNQAVDAVSERVAKKAVDPLTPNTIRTEEAAALGLKPAAVPAVEGSHAKIASGLFDPTKTFPEQPTLKQQATLYTHDSRGNALDLALSEDFSLRPSVPTSHILPKSASSPNLLMWKTNTGTREENIPQARNPNQAPAPLASPK
ncbi:MAG TPA: hypothetical protein VGV92_01380 [Gammaproteobacteria bacterium]|nr:hypothetical protein [Gammaproteobacteria bacterium]